MDHMHLTPVIGTGTKRGPTRAALKAWQTQVLAEAIRMICVEYEQTPFAEIAHIKAEYLDGMSDALADACGNVFWKLEA